MAAIAAAHVCPNYFKTYTRILTWPKLAINAVSAFLVNEGGIPQGNDIIPMKHAIDRLLWIPGWSPTVSLAALLCNECLL